MTYILTLNYIKNKAMQQTMVHSAEIGDVYKILAKPDVIYPIVTSDITEVNMNYYDGEILPVLSYLAHIYYADRVLQDNTNVKLIQSDACVTLLSLINDLFNDLGLEADYSISVWEQKFSDYCAGAYAQLEIKVYNELGQCDLNEDESYHSDPIVDRLKEIIKKYEKENADLALFLEEILYKLTGENV